MSCGYATGSNDLHISETTDIFIHISSGDNRSLNLHDLEFDDYTIGMALSSPLFTQEREDAASRGQAYHSPDESLLSSQSSFLISLVHLSQTSEIRVPAQKMTNQDSSGTTE